MEGEDLELEWGHGLDQDRNKRQAIVNAIMNIQVP